MAKDFLEVFHIRNYTHNNEPKSHWTRIGTAFQNEKDGSYNVLLDLLPLPEPQSGKIKLHMRLPRPKDGTPDEAMGNNSGMDEMFSIANSDYPYGDDL